MFNIEAEIRRSNRRTEREHRTPLVIYNRGRSYGLARLGNIGGYLGMTWPPDYSKARVITNPDDLHTIEEAEQTIHTARRAADKVYARAFKRGAIVTKAAADAAERRVR